MSDGEHGGTDQGVTFMARGLPNPERPRMLVSLGCSGSCVLMEVSRKLLGDHGISTWTPGGGPSGEMMKTPRANPFYTAEDGMGGAMKAANADALVNGATLVFKEQGAQSSYFREAAPDLQQLGTYVIHSYRRNVLDRMVCMTRDCVLNSTYGTPIDKDGKVSDLCFKRRGNTATDSNSAHINTDGLADRLKDFMQQSSEESDRMQNAGFRNYPTLAFEDLLDFEHDASAFDRGLNAWMQFLAGWGLTPQREVVKQRLMQYSGKYAAESQAETIHNYGEIAPLLRSDAQLASLLH